MFQCTHLPYGTGVHQIVESKIPVAVLRAPLEERPRLVSVSGLSPIRVLVCMKMSTAFNSNEAWCVQTEWNAVDTTKNGQKDRARLGGLHGHDKQHLDGRQHVAKGTACGAGPRWL